MKDRTVSLNGRLHEVDALLAGRAVVLRHGPAAPPTGDAVPPPTAMYWHPPTA